MKIADFFDYFRLKKSVENAWAFVRLRKKPRPGELFELRFNDGRVLYLRSGTRDAHVFNRLFIRDEYDILTGDIGQLGCVIDIGGHIGIFSFFLAPFADRVLIFEPVLENFELLRKNLSEDHFPNVICVHSAVSDSRKSVKIYKSPKATGAHSMYKKENVGDDFETVSALSLNDIFEEYGVDRCDLLKIDCEGAEYEILFSASEDVIGRISRIVLEYHPIGKPGAQFNVDSLRDYLKGRGFHVTMKTKKTNSQQGIMYCDR